MNHGNTKTVIGCDVDGVLTNLSAFNLRVGEKVFARKAVCPDAYALDEMFDVSDISKFKQYIKAFKMYCHYCNRESPQNGVKETIDYLSNNGFELHAITARKFATDKNLLGSIARKWLMKWLDKNEIRFIDIQLCDEVDSHKDKLLACRKLGVEAMIEDKPDNAIYLAENGIKVLMPDAPYNKNVVNGNITRVNNWEEIREELLSLNKRSDSSFSKIDQDAINALCEIEKQEYFQKYHQFLQDKSIDMGLLKKGNARFRALYRIMWLPASLFFHIRRFNEKNIPYQDGFILACNHCDSFDQYRIGLAIGNRPFVGYAAKEIEKTFRGRLFSYTGLGIFIDRNNREERQKASEKMATYVAKGRTALIFPEGTRKNKTKAGQEIFQNRFHAGTAALAQKTGAGILPVAINSFGGKVLARFGEIIYVLPTDSVPGKTQELELTIAGLSMENITYYYTKHSDQSKLEREKRKYEEYVDSIKSTKED